MTAGRAPDQAAFEGSLQAELAALQAFCETLRAEQDALLRADVDALLELSQRKTEQVERLSALAGVRSAFLEAHDLAADRRGMAQWLATHPKADPSGLAALWQQLLDSAAQARALNQRNGGLIDLRLQHNHAALSTLQAAARRHALYRPDGQADLGATTRDLGRA
jgi:flagella synthesis protein FlgN